MVLYEINNVTIHLVSLYAVVDCMPGYMHMCVCVRVYKRVCVSV